MIPSNEGESEVPLQPAEHEAGTDKSLPQDISDLLDAVLQETIGAENSESMDLVTRVAKASQIEDGNSREAAEELVRAIVDKKFGAGRFSSRLVRNIAGSLMESPEAMSKLTSLWQEARKQ